MAIACMVQCSSLIGKLSLKKNIFNRGHAKWISESYREKKLEAREVGFLLTRRVSSICLLGGTSTPMPLARPIPCWTSHSSLVSHIISHHPGVKGDLIWVLILGSRPS